MKEEKIGKNGIQRIEKKERNMIGNTMRNIKREGKITKNNIVLNIENIKNNTIKRNIEIISNIE